ncbi:PEP-CTERM sorting domain-containing protein [Synoicihabitans lomoniglobus]|uniref:PEP-CTERM sorting domain-containing protein n=1 Tax=Synoicihabitans lomoniglobus TaxID=2909285 RepID=A0AAF0CN89_9BACT|nr:PEP-CTERM sorting domain-containing protein [Opitutaceae bacterium LMO-M01]WED65193.1 PEP-CTERM sorting domain-containing protein [Opitutaceae bacterium LMO-M01]
MSAASFLPGQEFSLWATHGAAISYDSNTGVLTAITGNDSNYHWNKSSWAGRTGLKAFATTGAFNGQTVDAAFDSLTWTNVAGDSGDAYFNIMVQDAEGHRAILAPRYYGTNVNAVEASGFVTDNTQNWYSIFEAEAGWSGTGATGFGAATWDDIKDLTIANGPFAEFPDTLTGAATGQGDEIYAVSNWASWASDYGSAGAQSHGVLITFGQSTGTTPVVTQIGGIEINDTPVTFAANGNQAVVAPTAGSAAFTTLTADARTTVAVAESATLDSLTATGGVGTTRVVWADDAVVTLADAGTASVGSGAEFTGTGRIVGGLTVASGGTLSGDIAVSGTTTIASGGVFAPGFSPGAIYSSGDLLIADGGKLIFELGGLTAATGSFTDPTTGQFDQLFYGGAVTIGAGAILQLTDYNDFEVAAGETFNLLYAAGGITIDPGVVLTSVGGLTAFDFTVQVQPGLAFNGDGGSYDVLQITAVSAVPEPATAGAICGLAGVMLAGGRRRRRVLSL